MGSDRGDQRKRDDGGVLSATEQTENAELMLDREAEGAEPEHEAGEHAERLGQHTQQTDTPAHPESPARPDKPPRS